MEATVRTETEMHGAPAPAPAPPAGSGRRRSARALAGDARIRDEALRSLASLGPDGLRLHDVAHAAGFTHGAAYARYANVPDLLADLWVGTLRPAFAGWAGAVARAAATPDTLLDPDGPFGLPPPGLGPAIDLMIAAARVGELGDVVPAAVAEDLAAAGIPADPVATGLFALGIGAIFYLPGDGPLIHSLRGVAQRLVAGSATGDDNPPPAPEPVRPIVFATGDVLRDRILGATIVVAARSGVAGVTLRRISRISGYSSTVIYARYATLRELLIDVIVQATRATQDPDSQRRVLGSADALAANLAGWALPAATVRRRLLLEFHLAAAHDRGLLGQGMAEDSATYGAAAPVVAPAAEPGAVVARQRLARDAAIGAALLADLGLADAIAWLPIARAIVPDDATG